MLISECYYVGLVLSMHGTGEDALEESPIAGAILAHAMYTQAKMDLRETKP